MNSLLRFYHKMVSLKFVRTVALHCKKPEVDLTRNIISVAVWIHPGPGGCPHPIAVVLPWFPCPVKQTVNLVAHFVIAYFWQTGVELLFMCY